MRNTLTFALATALIAAPALAADFKAQLENTNGDSVGTAMVTETESGEALVVLDLSGLPEGPHGVHLHETGDCSASDFSSAGGHIAGDAAHGVLSADGPHPGDLPNIEVGADGSAKYEFFLTDFEIERWLQDDDGAAFIVHAGADDYTSQPAGDSGDRIACGVFAAGA